MANDKINDAGGAGSKNGVAEPEGPPRPRGNATKLLVLVDAKAIDAMELTSIRPTLHPKADADNFRMQARKAAERYPALAAKARSYVRHDPVGARRAARAELAAIKNGSREVARGIAKAERIFDADHDRGRGR